MKPVLYPFVYSGFYVVSLLPMKVLHILSDVSTFLLHRVLRYRLKVVRANLVSAFPEKSDRELRRIERGFYSFLGDYVAETLKLASISEKEMKRRMKFTNIDLIRKEFEDGKDVSLFLGHYCNWEWISTIPLYMPKEMAGGQIYKPLHNKVLDLVFLKIRNRFGSKCIRKADSLHDIMASRKQGKVTVTGYIADQIPSSANTHLWVPFLNHDTAVFTGTERISRILGAKVFYIDIKRVKRGYYEATFVPLKASLDEKDAVTKEYFTLLEATIRRDPPYWLWSHRRWKRRR